MNNLKINKDIIYDLYIMKNNSIRDIAKIYDTTYRNIQRRIKSWKIKKNKSDKIKSFRKNFKKTMNKKYGVDHYMKSDDGYELYKNKLKSTHKVTNIMQLDTTKKNRSKTCMDKYGVDHSLKDPGVRQKIKSTCLKTYGVDNPFKSRELMKNVHISNQIRGNGSKTTTRFGTIYVKSKLEKLFIKRFCADSRVRDLKYESIRIEGDTLYIPDFLINNDKIIEIKPSRLMNLRVADCKNDYLRKTIYANQTKEEIGYLYSKLNNMKYHIITEKTRTNFEYLFKDDIFNEIYEFVNCINGGIANNNVILNKSVSIYYNDLTDNIRPKNNAIMIYKDEWVDHEIAVKSIIMKKLGAGIPPLTIEFTECEVKIAKNIKKVKDFYRLNDCNRNHVPAKHHVCLMFMGIIIACMSTKKSGNNWEICRMCVNRKYMIHDLWQNMFSWLSKHVGSNNFTCLSNNRYPIDMGDIDFSVRRKIRPSLYSDGIYDWGQTEIVFNL